MPRFAFIFPPQAGHFNASIPVAQALMASGHEVHYLCQESMRPAIQATGAVFHSDTQHKTELYTAERGVSEYSPMMLIKEMGLEAEHPILAIFKTNTLIQELSLPGVLRWLNLVAPDAVFYNPELCTEVPLAVTVAGLPSVGLLTLAGPGGMEAFLLDMLGQFGLTSDLVLSEVRTYQPAVDARARMSGLYRQDVPDDKLLGKMSLRHNFATFVTTISSLQEPMSPELAEAYTADGVDFTYVGPLSLESSSIAREASDVLERVQVARSTGRSVILVSMGTMIPGLETWDKRPDGAGLANGELCRAVWRAAFTVFGASGSGEGPLLVLSTGPHPDTLSDIEVPPNAICLPVVPQADILAAGVDMFLTHGGQNSFMEALANSTPLVVCPVDTDQPANARKAVAMGVGLKVDRPDHLQEDGSEAIAAKYSEQICAALHEVTAAHSYKAAAEKAGRQMHSSGKVSCVVTGLLEAAGQREGSKS